MRHIYDRGTIVEHQGILYKITGFKTEYVWSKNSKWLLDILVLYELDNNKIVYEDEVTFVKEKEVER